MPNTHQLVRASSLGNYCNLLIELGFDPQAVLHTAKLDPHLLKNIDQNAYIPAELENNLLAAAANVTCKEHFAALLGSQEQIELLGLAAPAIAQSNTPRQVFEKLISTMSLHAPNHIKMALRCQGDTTSYFCSANTFIGRHAAEMSAGQLVAIFSRLSKTKWRPLHFKFTHSAPRHLAPLHEILGNNILFDQPIYECLIASEWLEKPLAKTQTNLLAVLNRASKPLAHSTPHIHATVERLICLTLPSGNCTIESIANQLQMHRRTLHRKLQQCDTSFKEILEQVRQNYASRQLGSGVKDIQQLARDLGYADQTAFSRAFKRWYKTTPLAWQKHRLAKNRLTSKP